MHDVRSAAARQGDQRTASIDQRRAAARRPTGSNALRRTLIGIDAFAITAAWGTILLPSSFREEGILAPATALVPLLTLGGLWLLFSSQLYRARVASVRTVEITKLARVAVTLGLVAFALAVAIDRQPRLREVGAGIALSLVLLVAGRGEYRNWLKASRTEGRFARDVLLVGIDAEGADVVDLLDSHPELGFRLSGVVGDRHQAMAHGLGDRWLGPLSDALPVMLDQQATGAIVVTSAIPNPLLNQVCRDLVDHGGHVHVTSGLRGIDHRRLRPQLLAYEPFFYLEPLALSRAQRVLKRAIDLALSVFGLVVAGPVLAVAAIVVKLHDGGPVLFRQQRVGLDGATFTMFKLRTMVPDAERRLHRLADRNQRDGPLFKLDSDPRITRVGRFLRATSIDELPQLFNVVRGEMSLVGPRPALPSEVAQFDDDLSSRTRVLPGMTGLWQVEARDDPSFSSYRRLDLFYVENWGVTFDLVILLATVESEFARATRTARRKATERARTAVSSSR